MQAKRSDTHDRLSLKIMGNGPKHPVTLTMSRSSIRAATKDPAITASTAMRRDFDRLGKAFTTYMQLKDESTYGQRFDTLEAAAKDTNTYAEMAANIEGRIADIRERNAGGCPRVMGGAA